MLPRGGSRLNASKPEANPKIRCPILFSQTKTHTLSQIFVVLCGIAFLFFFFSSLTGVGKKRQERKCPSLSRGRGKKNITQKIESPHKPYSHTRARWRIVHQIITRNPKTLSLSGRISRCAAETTQKTHLQRPSPNERTCMGWHKRYAPISVGAQGAFTSRGAKP